VHLAADGTAYALVEDQVVAGDPRCVRAAIDAAEGDSLAESESFEKAFDRVAGEEGIGRAYLAPRTLFEHSGMQQGGGMLGSLASGALTGALPTSVAARLHADGDALRAEIATVGGADPGKPADPEVLAGVTGKAWAAAAIGEVGPRLRDQLKSLGGSEAMLGLLSAQAGLDIERDLLAWMGEGAIFALGTGEDERTPAGALVVRSKDAAATRAAIPKLSALIGRFASGVTTTPLRESGVNEGFTLDLPGTTRPVHVAAAGDLFVVAVGGEALREAISPSSRLGDAARFQAASATLGDDLKPMAYVDIQALADKAGPQAGDLHTYLSRFAALVAADRGEGRWRAAAAFR
jgi:peptidoglycan hydrolase-like protein with peptidoglycan-binding domain